MQITRMDLADVGSPAGLVAKILKVETDLPDKVPIESLATQLDIVAIQNIETDGFVGGLITDDAKDEGIILVADNLQRARRRFTIGHELGHFLILTHRPAQQGKFLCRAEDMRVWSLKDQDAYKRMEAEANEFAALLLMPPPRLRPLMARYREASLLHVPALANHFDVSKEVAARAYARYHDEAIAIAVIHDGVVKRIFKQTKFPFVTVSYGQKVPSGSMYYRRGTSCSDVQEGRAELWLQSDWGKPMPKLYEQVYTQQDGYALLMLWAELPEESDEDEDEDRTAKERYRDRVSRSWPHQR